MTDTPSRRRHGLGRGLSALMGDYPDDAGAAGAPRDAMTAPIDLLVPNRFQPRHRFDESALKDLVASIRENGVLQPILVRPSAEDASAGASEGERHYEIVAGERRWRAAQAAGLHEVPVVVRALDDAAALEIALVENVQRRDLSPIEEAEGYRRLIDEFGHRQEDIASTVGKSRSHIANLLRLLTLPDPVRAMLDDGRLSMGHARALIGADDPERLARRVVNQGLSVRETERLAVTEKPVRRRGGRSAPAKDADTRALESDLSQALGLAVEIAHRGERGGSVTIRYRTLEQLDELCRHLIGH